MLRISALLLAILGAILPAQGTTTESTATKHDGGMWTFDKLPVEDIKAKYNFEITNAWADHVRLASLRVSTGGSASFVSSKGLVLTNHHVAFELASHLSTVENDFIANGFYAATMEEEMKCPGATLTQLLGMKDVTDRVQAATATATDSQHANQLRQAAVASISKELSAEADRQVDIVSLYGGGKYVAYFYEVYDDVRLVFFPEDCVGAFGGDLDNFTYPRWCLDMALLRAYKDDKPVDSSNFHFRWNPKGPSKGDLVFVSGNPGSTARLWPLARLAHERDTYNPGVLELLKGREEALASYSELGDAQALKVLDELKSIRNSLKAFQGQQVALNNPDIWARKEQEESEFRKATNENPDVEAAFAVYGNCAEQRNQVFRNLIFCRLDGTLGSRAMQVAGLTRALALPEDQRPAALRGEGLVKVMASLCNTDSIDQDLALRRLVANLKNAQTALGNRHPYCQTAFDGTQSPVDAAEAMLKDTILLRSDDLKALLEAGGEAIANSEDKLIRLAGIASQHRGQARGVWMQAEAQEAEAGAVLAQARFKVYGDAVYPDATFTLRLSYGVCEGYEEGTTLVPWTTTLYGLFGRHASMGGVPPFNLPENWLNARSSLDLSTPYNFVSTNDIIGGNSGSPVINKDMEVVGLIFDGNIQSLSARYLYTDRIVRAVSVHSAGMTHALDRVYKTKRILEELGL